MNRTSSLMVTVAALVGASLVTAVPGVTLRTARAQDAAPAAMQGASADAFFHVEWVARADRNGRPRITGFLYNDSGDFATTVRLRIKELDASGKVIASEVRSVSDVPPENRVYFDVPALRGGQGYQVTVDSYDLIERGD